MLLAYGRCDKSRASVCGFYLLAAGGLTARAAPISVPYWLMPAGVLMGLSQLRMSHSLFGIPRPVAFIFLSLLDSSAI